MIAFPSIAACGLEAIVVFPIIHSRYWSKQRDPVEIIRAYSE